MVYGTATWGVKKERKPGSIDMYKRTYVHTSFIVYVHTCINAYAIFHYVTLHYIALHYATLHIPLHCSTVHYANTTLHCYITCMRSHLQFHSVPWQLHCNYKTYLHSLAKKSSCFEGNCFFGLEMNPGSIQETFETFRNPGFQKWCTLRFLPAWRKKYKKNHTQHIRFFFCKWIQGRFSSLP